MLAPLLLMLALGGFTAMSADKEYKSTGVLNVTSDDLLGDLTGTQTQFTIETAATLTSRAIGEQLQTDIFIDRVIERAGLTTAVETGQRTRDQIRSSISTSTRGDNLVAVSATTSSPVEAQALAEATLAEFRDFVVENDVGSAQFSSQLLEQALEEAEEEATAATAELKEYLDTHPSGDEDDRPADQVTEIDRLKGAQARADDMVAETQTQLDVAQREAQNARLLVEQQLRTLDAPEVPTSPEAGLKNLVLTVGVFFVLGSILSGALIILAAAFDRSIRTPHDVEAHFGLDVLAVVPAKKR
jgi:capsular polysaccharide biosynthesis protein